MALGLSLVWDLIAKDSASPAFLRVAGAADKAAASTARATKGIGGSAAKMGAVGAKLTKGLTLPLLGLGAVAVDQAAKFQTSLNTIQVATDRTNRQMAAGAKGLETVAKSTGTTLGDLSDSFYVASKSGASVAKSLEITRAAAEGAKAENADLGTVTDALTSIMASYGKSLGNPIAAMNEIIKGAGLAKTTTQDFSASLSNVVPIASALHISFDQVAGAIATMTQHGETAQRATDNLSNLITNLAGQNNVAASALGQLGINTVDLSRKLGKRGLTGSLNLVLDAIAKHGKDGLIVTDAFKQSATAVSSLRQELAAMPKALQGQAEAFDKGKLSYKDFYTYAKSLGGQQYQLAKGFIATEGTAKGFSSQLKSGNSTVSTLARTLQKALGGVTGMRTALMLSGNSAKTFASDTEQVRKAALEAGADVLGWGRTQDTLAVKMDKAKASLQVLAVEIGAKLIPVVTKIVGAVTSAVHWFENLSGTQKKVLAWSAGILAAMGPVLSIGSKLILLGSGLSRFAVGAGNAFARIGGSATGMSAGVTSAMRGMSAAIGGAAVGLAIGTLTANASTATKAVGALASAAAGAAIGFGAGGPWGAAIGGAVGLLGNLASGFLGSGKSAQQAAAEIQSYTDAIKADSGALGKNLDALVAHSLQQSGALDAARTLGIGNLHLVTLAAEGNKRALAEISPALNKYSFGLYGASKDTSGLVAASKTLRAAIGGQNSEIGKATQAYKNEKAATSGAASSTRGAAQSIAATGSAAADAAPKVNNLGSFSHRLGVALQALSGTHTVNVDTSAAQSNVLSLSASLSHMISLMASASGGTATPLLGAHPDQPKGNAAGGIIRGPGTGTSDSILRRVSNGEFVVRASQVPANRGLLENINKGVGGFRSGGHVGVSMPAPRLSSGSGVDRGGGVQRMTLDLPGVGVLTGFIERTAYNAVIDEADLGGTLGRMR